MPGTRRRTSTPARAASSRLAYSGGGAIRYASVIHRRSVALAARSWTARYMRARPGTPDRTRAVEDPHSAGSASSSSGGSGAPARRQMRANASSSAAAAGPVTATMVSRHGLRPRAGSPAHSLPMHSPPVIAQLPSVTSSLR